MSLRKPLGPEMRPWLLWNGPQSGWAYQLRAITGPHQPRVPRTNAEDKCHYPTRGRPDTTVIPVRFGHIIVSAGLDACRLDRLPLRYQPRTHAHSRQTMWAGNRCSTVWVTSVLAVRTSPGGRRGTDCPLE